MIDLKNLTENFLQGNLSSTDKEHLLSMIKSDKHIDAWMRRSIEMTDNFIPDVVRDRVMDQITSEKSDKQVKHKVSRYWKRMAIAAICLLCLCMGTLSWYSFVDHHSGNGVVTIKTGIGEHSNVTLPDGTNVVLNAKTTLSYNCSLENGLREVTLTGEAFFDVVSNEEHPFIVNATDLVVECLGTSFSVRNYEEAKSVSVILSEGKVNVVAGGSELMMEPNNRVEYNKDSKFLAKQQVDASNYLCWLNNEIRYNNCSLEDIAMELSRNYNIQIIVTTDKLKNERFTGYLGHSTLRNVLEILSMTSGVKYYFDNESVVYLCEK